jgi:hypothetical protein
MILEKPTEGKPDNYGTPHDLHNLHNLHIDSSLNPHFGTKIPHDLRHHSPAADVKAEPGASRL